MSKSKNKQLSIKDLLSTDLDKLDITSISFENGMSLLEELVSQVEDGELSLEGSIESYEKGVRVMEHLKSQLTGAEKRLEKISKSKKK